MEQFANTLEQALDRWCKGDASVEELRSLAADLGNQHFSLGIPAAIELLDHEDEIVRYNAAMSLGHDFRHKPAADKLLNMLDFDPDEDCREVAAGGLGNIFQNSKDRHVLEGLAKAALNDPDDSIRSSAYQALLIVNGVSREEHLRLLTSGEKLHVDPARVKAILAATPNSG